jgi:AraC family transcriptional regulator
MSLIPAYDQITTSGTRHASTVATRSDFPAITTETDNGEEALARHLGLVTTLVRILRGAAEAIYRDRDIARANIDRSLALLQASQNWNKIGHEHSAATLVRGGLAPWKVVHISAHIDAHLDSTIRMSDLAEIARLSTGHFSRSFTRSVGVTPFAYIAGRRLARAQNLMLTTDDPLSQIALACGFCDQSQLTRLFRRFLGTNPSTWRRCHRSEPVTPFVAPTASASRLVHALCRTAVHSTAVPKAFRCCETRQQDAKPEDLTC